MFLVRIAKKLIERRELRRESEPEENENQKRRESEPKESHAGK